MNYSIKKGLFEFDFNDRHAILGVAVDCDANGIRDRYKELARQMHPDSSRWGTKAEKELAIKLFSNLVTHAYGKLSRTNQLQEQQMMLELMGKRLVVEASKIEISSDAAQKLFRQGSADLYSTYQQLLQELASQQYQQLDRSLEITGHISELNMVYLLRKQNQSIHSGSNSPSVNLPREIASTVPASNKSEMATATPAAPEPAKVAANSNSLRRAEEYINMRNWAKANIELREFLKGEPSNAKAHAQLAIVYLRQNQSTMAKMHMNKAIQLDPQDPQVRSAKQEIKKLMTEVKVSNEKGKGGLFGLFGKK